MSNEVLNNEIREELKKYKKHKEFTCLECGYKGFMGVGKYRIHWLVRLPLNLAIIFFAIVVSRILGGGLIGLVIIFLITFKAGSLTSKRFFHCPNCKTALTQK